jgi:hypothetical protein
LAKKQKRKKIDAGGKRLKKRQDIDWFEDSRCWEPGCDEKAVYGLTRCPIHVPEHDLLAVSAVFKRKFAEQNQ